VSFRRFYPLFINPRGRPPAWRPPNTRKLMTMGLKFFRRFSVSIILILVMSAFIIGVLTNTGSNLSIYDDFGIKDTTDRPSGFLWTILWWWRGQPAGFENNPDSWFTYHYIPIISEIIGPMTTVHKTDIGSVIEGDRGYNGPLTLWGFLTEWFVDATIYMPKFLDLGWLAVNGDILLPFFFKFAVDFAILIAILFILAVFMLPFGFFSGAFFIYLLQFISAMAGPVLKILLIIFIVGGIIAALTGNLQWLQDLLSGV